MQSLQSELHCKCVEGIFVHAVGIMSIEAQPPTAVLEKKFVLLLSPLSEEWRLNTSERFKWCLERFCQAVILDQHDVITATFDDGGFHAITLSQINY